MTPPTRSQDLQTVRDAINKANMMLCGYGANNTVFLADAMDALNRLAAAELQDEPESKMDCKNTPCEYPVCDCKELQRDEIMELFDEVPALNEKYALNELGQYHDEQVALIRRLADTLKLFLIWHREKNMRFKSMVGCTLTPEVIASAAAEALSSLPEKFKTSTPSQPSPPSHSGGE